MLNSLLEDSDDNDYDELIHFLPKEISIARVSEIFTIVPHEGCLEPDELIMTHFRFTPQPNTEVSATVYCHIVGGANEQIKLKGKCKKISFYLKKNQINFGKIYFYDVSQYEMSITNDGEGKFNFEISEAMLLSGWLKIEPSIGLIHPGETFPITLKCYPGSVGRFETNFDIEIGYLDPVTIKVFGCGVYPNVYFSLPRPDLALIDPFITYSAIAELDEKMKGCECCQEYFPEIDKQILEENDWVVILYSDCIPCTMEIDLSIERIAAKMNNDNGLDRLTKGEKFWPVPNFIVASYILDLGCIQINTKTLHSVPFMNYGPGRTVVKTQVSSSFNKHGFEISLFRRVMDLNQVVELNFSFHPTSEKYHDLNTKVTEVIFVDVRNGPRIPIQIEVLVATPTVAVSDEEVDFGAIRCGDCLRKSINIINEY